MQTLPRLAGRHARNVRCTFASCHKRAEFNLLERQVPVPLCRGHLHLIVTPTSQVEPIHPEPFALRLAV